jgi:methylase of polypeptide subunit release factors
MEIPQITKKQFKFMKSFKKDENIVLGGITLEIQPFMFPPKSPYSYSTLILLKKLNVKGKNVLEIGTGCGVLSILAVKKGASFVEGVDIFPQCLEIAKKNAKKNNVDDKVRFYYSDMFLNVPDKHYDMIICNLPIVEGELPDNNPMWYSLFDPKFKYHKELFSKAQKYTSKIIIAHANLKGKDDFDKFEDLAKKYGWNIKINHEIEYKNYKWRNYELIKKSKLKADFT